MSECVFGWPIYNDPQLLSAPVYSAGSWDANNPLTNLSDRRLQRVARSTNATTGSTQFQVDLGMARAIRVIAIPYHTISTAGTIRIRANTSASFGSAPYDSGTLNVWPGGFTIETVQGMNLGFTLVPAAAQTYRYWLIEIVDTGNAAGHVDLGRLILAAGYQPSFNMAYGAKVGIRTNTTRQETPGGQAMFNKQPQRRTFAFSLDDIDVDEALANGFDMQRIAGLDGQIHFVFDPSDDAAHMARRSFLCTLNTLSPTEYPYFGGVNQAWDLVEEL